MNTPEKKNTGRRARNNLPKLVIEELDKNGYVVMTFAEMLDVIAGQSRTISRRDGLLTRTISVPKAWFKGGNYNG